MHTEKVPGPFDKLEGSQQDLLGFQPDTPHFFGSGSTVKSIKNGGSAPTTSVEDSPLFTARVTEIEMCASLSITCTTESSEPYGVFRARTTAFALYFP